MQETEKKSFIMGISTGVVVIALLGGVFYLGTTYGQKGPSANTPTVNAPTGQQPTQPTQPPEADASKIASVSDGDHVRGNPNAKITMVEYSDFECPFCARFIPTVEQVLAEYPNDVRLVYRHFPLRSIHPNAQKAAEASECAADQGKFWEMHDKLFELNTAQNLTLASMKQAAVDLGLITGDFNDCLDDGAKAAEVEADYQDGLQAGVSGTPGTFVNTQYVAGALPFESVKSIVESQL